jgi:hypothetical protein
MVTESLDQEVVDVAVIPNPTKDGRTRIVIRGNHDRVPFRIVNAQGTLVLEDHVDEEEKLVDLSGQPVGLYLLKLRTSRGIVVKKILIER